MKLSHSGVSKLVPDPTSENALPEPIGVRGTWFGKETNGRLLGGENNPVEVKGPCPLGGDFTSTI